MSDSNKQKKSRIGTCKLCLQERELSKKSHIIPNFMITKSVNKEKNGFVAINPKTKQSKRVYDEGYEMNILCLDCEQNTLSKYETYASKFLYAGLRPNEILNVSEYEAYHEIKNVNYHLLKLFFLSLLWRFSISSRFPTIKLTEVQEDRLRYVILNSSYVAENEFPVILWQCIIAQNIPGELIMYPWIDQNRECFHFFIHKMQIQILIHDKSIAQFYEQSMLKENGSICVIKTPPDIQAKLLNKLSDTTWIKE